MSDDYNVYLKEDVLMSLCLNKQIYYGTAVSQICECNIDLRKPPDINGWGIFESVVLIGQDNPVENGVYLCRKNFKKHTTLMRREPTGSNAIRGITYRIKHPDYDFVILLNDGIIGTDGLYFTCGKINKISDTKFTLGDKQLELPCFGEYMCGDCFKRIGCLLESYCSTYTFKTKGVCECKYKEACALPRQQLQKEFKERNLYYEIGYECPFFKLIEEEDKKETKPL